MKYKLALSLVLSLIITTSVVTTPKSASAAVSIHTCTELQAMFDNPSAAYSLDNDINCGDAATGNDTSTWNAGAGFVPVGSSTNRFTGSLNGNHHTIQNLTIMRPAV